MSIPLLALDDRRFDDLVKEFQALVPRYAEEWTNRNAADPGIMLLELFAWLTESQIYRINRVPKPVALAFLNWLLAAETASTASVTAAQIKAAQRAVHQLYSHPERLITKSDYETIIRDKFPQTVARVACFPERDFTATPATRLRRGHLSVVLVAQPVVQPIAQYALQPMTKYQHVMNTQGQRIVLFSETQVLTWCAAGPVEAIMTPLPAGEVIVACIVSPDDQVVAVISTPKDNSAAAQNRLTLWDSRRGKIVWSADLPAAADAGSFCFGSRYLTLTLANGQHPQFVVETGRSIDLTTEDRSNLPRLMRRQAQPSTQHSPGEWLAVSADGQRKARFISARLSVWDSTRGDELALFVMPKQPTATFFSPDSRYLVTISVRDAGQPHPQQLSVWAIDFDNVAVFVDNNRQVGCQQHVVGCCYRDLTIAAEVVVAASAPTEKQKKEIITRLQNFFDPRTGGPNGAGWPFGRQVTQSEVHHVIHTTPDVEHVVSLTLNGESEDLEIGEHELVNLMLPPTITVKPVVKR